MAQDRTKNEVTGIEKRKCSHGDLKSWAWFKVRTEGQKVSGVKSREIRDGVS